MIRKQFFYYLKGLILLSALSIFFNGCKKDTNVPEGIDVLPKALVYQANAGDVETFAIQGFSTKNINRIRINTKRKNGFSVVQLDSSFAGRENFSFIWEYKFENAQEMYELGIYFILSDESGRDFTTDRLIQVNISDPYLNEYAGISFYSSWSGQPNALYLQDLTVRNAYLNQASVLDIMDDSTSIGPDSLLGKSWISPAGGRFMRFNGFNFAEATEKSLSGAIAAGTFSDRVDQIKQGDIILYHRTGDSLRIKAAIRVLGVYDNPGTGSDYYDISVKKQLP
jgi:hypothetical protein